MQEKEEQQQQKKKKKQWQQDRLFLDGKTMAWLSFRRHLRDLGHLVWLIAANRPVLMMRRLFDPVASSRFGCNLHLCERRIQSTSTFSDVERKFDGE